LLPAPTDFKTFAQYPARFCVYYEQLRSHQFVLAYPQE
jgi:hypothetical protein